MGHGKKPDKRLIRELTPRVFLSFGPDFPGLELQDLNVLIGANGSGKSNLIEALSLMRAAPRDWRDVTRRGGGAAEWIWKGERHGTASIEAIVRPKKQGLALRHGMAFSAINQGFTLDDERLENEMPHLGQEQPYFYYRYQDGDPVLNTMGNGVRRLSRDSVDRGRSILAQRRDPDMYPEIAWLASSYEKIRIYREWAFGRAAVFREPQKADMPLEHEPHPRWDSETQ